MPTLQIHLAYRHDPAETAALIDAMTRTMTRTIVDALAVARASVHSAARFRGTMI